MVMSVSEGRLGGDVLSRKGWGARFPGAVGWSTGSVSVGRRLGMWVVAEARLRVGWLDWAMWRIANRILGLCVFPV